MSYAQVFNKPINFDTTRVTNMACKRARVPRKVASTLIWRYVSCSSAHVNALTGVVARGVYELVFVGPLLVGWLSASDGRLSEVALTWTYPCVSIAMFEGASSFNSPVDFDTRSVTSMTCEYAKALYRVLLHSLSLGTRFSSCHTLFLPFSQKWP